MLSDVVSGWGKECFFSLQQFHDLQEPKKQRMTVQKNRFMLLQVLEVPSGELT